MKKVKLFFTLFVERISQEGGEDTNGCVSKKENYTSA